MLIYNNYIKTNFKVLFYLKKNVITIKLSKEKIFLIKNFQFFRAFDIILNDIEI